MILNPTNYCFRYYLKNISMCKYLHFLSLNITSILSSTRLMDTFTIFQVRLGLGLGNNCQVLPLEDNINTLHLTERGNVTLEILKLWEVSTSNSCLKGFGQPCWLMCIWFLYTVVSSFLLLLEKNDSPTVL